MACIVIADDDMELASFITYSFEAAGHDVRATLDGATALELIRKHRPDLVVLDNQMPGMTGLEVAAALRADPDTAGLPILMITACDVGDGVRLVDRLVPKPLRARQLAAVMTEMLAVK